MGCSPSKGATTHREVTFGRRPTVADVVKIEANPQSGIEAQNTLIYVQAAITKLGTLPRATLSALLQLDDTDRQILVEGYLDFLRESLGERVAEELSDSEFKLALGLDENGETYDLLAFSSEPKPFTGHDEVRLERQYGSGLRKELALVAREVVKLSSSENGVELDGAVTVEMLERLDAYDFGKLREFLTRRRDSFRRARRTLQGDDE